ncbi:hypothetical protein PS2_032972 [Malus domestica]
MRWMWVNVKMIEKLTSSRPKIYGGWQRVRDTVTPSCEALVASKEDPSRIETARLPSNIQISRQIGGSSVVDLTMGSCHWALDDHLHVLNDQLGRAFNLLGPQPSRSLDFHFPLDLSLSVELVQLDEGPYEVNGRTADGSRLTNDEVAQDVVHLKSTSGLESPSLHIFPTSILDPPTHWTALSRKGSKQKRMLELQQSESGLSATKKIKKGDGGTPRQMKARFRNICVQSSSVEGERDSLVRQPFLELSSPCPALGIFSEGSGDLKLKVRQEKMQEGSSCGGGDWPLTAARQS